MLVWNIASLLISNNYFFSIRAKNNIRIVCNYDNLSILFLSLNERNQIIKDRTVVQIIFRLINENWTLAIC